MYSALYLSDDPEAENHEYAYASQLKLMGAINAGSLDVVLMNGEAYNILSQSGSLLELTDLLSRNNTALFRSAEPYITGIPLFFTTTASLCRILSSVRHQGPVTHFTVKDLEITYLVIPF